MVFISGSYAFNIPQLNQESSDLPSPAISPGRAAILRFGFLSIGFVKSDHFNPDPGKLLIQRISIIGLIAHYLLRQPNPKTTFDGRTNQLHFMRRRRPRGSTRLDTEGGKGFNSVHYSSVKSIQHIWASITKVQAFFEMRCNYHG